MNKLNHVAIIMDGNGRWGIKKNQSRNFGHLHQYQSIIFYRNSSINLKIPFRYLLCFFYRKLEKTQK